MACFSFRFSAGGGTACHTACRFARGLRASQMGHDFGSWRHLLSVGWWVYAGLLPVHYGICHSRKSPYFKTLSAMAKLPFISKNHLQLYHFRSKKQGQNKLATEPKYRGLT